MKSMHVIYRVNRIEIRLQYDTKRIQNKFYSNWRMKKHLVFSKGFITFTAFLIGCLRSGVRMASAGGVMWPEAWSRSRVKVDRLIWYLSLTYKSFCFIGNKNGEKSHLKTGCEMRNWREIIHFSRSMQA